MLCTVKLLPNLTEWPDPAKTPNSLNVKKNPDLIIKVGDLHANPLKKLWCLVYFGILDLDKDAYEKLRDIIGDAINSNKLNDTILAEFKHILDNTRVHEKQLHVFLEIGDKYSDRRGHDVVMFILDDILNKKLLPYKTAVSNHDLDMISFFHGDNKYWDHKNNTVDCKQLRKTWLKKVTTLDDTAYFNLYELSVRSNMFQDYSLQLLINSITNKQINPQKISEIFHQVYLPHLCLVFYTLEDNGISIDMHAPNPLWRLKYAMNELYQIVEYFVPAYVPQLIPWNDTTKEMLARSIDATNYVFSEIIQGKIGDEARDELIEILNTPDTALHALCWSRYVEYDHGLEFCNARADGSIADYEIYITNGHDNPNCEPDFSSFNTCLNDQCGQYEDTKYNSETKADTNFLMISVHKRGMPLSRPKMIDLTQNDVQAYEAEVKKLALLLSLPINKIAAIVESANDETQDGNPPEK